MFTQFFRDSGPRTCCYAWAGLLVVMGYSAFSAWTSARVNEFYNEFYDLLQHRVAEEAETGSGAFEREEGEEDLAALRGEVWAQLAGFGMIVLPLVFANPVARWVRSAWAFAWRVALMRAYLDAWDVALDPIEGASQRLHEDTQRFCNALQGCLGAMLDATFTLIVFAPILVDLSRTIHPPDWLRPLEAGWLLTVAYMAASVGLAGAMIAGKQLVDLEVNNQRVEASLRRDLVVLETAPNTLFGDPPVDVDASPRSSRGFRDRGACASPLLFFSLTLKRLATNYHALFRNFAALNLWLTAFDQIMVLLPYVIAGPLLFADDPAERITLGTLVKLSNSFHKVFGSLSIVAENWSLVNEFRSVVRRLREFEARLFAPPPLPNDGGGGRQRESCRRLVSHADFRDSQLRVDALPSARAPVAPVAAPAAPAASAASAARGGRGAQQRAEEALRSRAPSPSPSEVATRSDGAAIELVEAELSERELAAVRGPGPDQRV